MENLDLTACLLWILDSVDSNIWLRQLKLSVSNSHRQSFPLLKVATDSGSFPNLWLLYFLLLQLKEKSPIAVFAYVQIV